MDPGSAPWGPGVGQEEQAGADAREVPPGYVEELCCAGVQALEQIGQRGWGSPHTPTFPTVLKGESHNCDITSPPALSALSPMSHLPFSPPACPKS